MRIKSRVWFSIAASVLISVAIACVVASIINATRRDFSRSAGYLDIINEASALDILVNNFKDRPGERVISQITMVNASLRKMLGSISPQDEAERFQFEHAWENYEKLEPLLGQLSQNQSGPDVSLEADRKLLLATQLRIKARAISDDVTRLMDINQARILTAQNQAQVLVIVLLALIILVNAGISYVSNHAIVREVLRLNEGVKRVAQGDLEHLVKERGKDELAELAGNFNRMTRALASSLDSLKSHQEGLEGLVEERTVRLRESEALMRLFIEHSPAAMAMFDREMRYLAVSNHWLEEYGLVGQELPGRSHYEIFPEIPERWKEIHRRCLAGAVERAAAEPFARADGSTQWIRWEVRPWHTATNEVGGIIIFSEDITERKLIEENLRLRQFELREAQRIAHVGSWYWDATSDATFGSVEIYNIFGLDPTQAFPAFQDQKGRQYPVESWERVHAAVQETVRTGIGYELEVPAFRKGAAIWITTRCECVRDGDGRIVALRGTVQDITERKRVERMFQEAKEEADRLAESLEVKVRERTRELERSNRELQDFAFVASHDLQEPLRKIQVFSDRLRQENGDSLTESGRDCLDRMVSASERMRDLIGSLLDYSRLSKMPAALNRVDLNDVVQSVLDDLEARLAETGGRVTVETLPQVEADKVQMGQLFQNLLSNALKYHRPGVPPDVLVRGEVRKRTDGGEVCELTVSDNGIGFDEKYRDKIFTPFQRLHGRKEFPGTGIGLTICRKIVERHEGTISARGEPGKGTKITVILPLEHKKVMARLPEVE
jgi:PAS domain S-box-containing protein